MDTVRGSEAAEQSAPALADVDLAAELSVHVGGRDLGVASIVVEVKPMHGRRDKSETHG